MNATLPRVLTIAGSDSGGGAGIEADLKTISALGCYGMAAVTAVTAQNTVGVFGIHEIPPETVARQIDVVLEDIGADAAKLGMLSSVGIIEAVAGSLRRQAVEKLVIDPVMVAKSGDALLRENAREALKRELLPLAWMVTPNIPEAEVLSGLTITTEEEVWRAGEVIHGLGPKYVLMKGGHLAGTEATDWLFDGANWSVYSAERIDTKNTHGTGCTFSAAIAACLARGKGAREAVEEAKTYLSGAIRHALSLGHGHGPLNHLWRMSVCHQDGTENHLVP